MLGAVRPGPPSTSRDRFSSAGSHSTATCAPLDTVTRTVTFKWRPSAKRDPLPLCGQVCPGGASAPPAIFVAGADMQCTSEPKRCSSFSVVVPSSGTNTANRSWLRATSSSAPRDVPALTRSAFAAKKPLGSSRSAPRVPGHRRLPRIGDIGFSVSLAIAAITCKDRAAFGGRGCVSVLATAAGAPARSDRARCGRVWPQSERASRPPHRAEPRSSRRCDSRGWSRAPSREGEADVQTIEKAVARRRCSARARRSGRHWSDPHARRGR